MGQKKIPLNKKKKKHIKLQNILPSLKSLSIVKKKKKKSWQKLESKENWVRGKGSLKLEELQPQNKSLF